MDVEPPRVSRRRMRRPGGRAAVSLLRGLWRYRGQLEDHHRAWLVEAATAVHTVLHRRLLGRAALAAYRMAMRVLLAACVLCILLAILPLVVAGFEWWAVALAAIPAVGAGLTAWYWFVWGAALRMLDEYADPTREVAIRDLPARLRELAAEGKELATVPASLLRDLATVEESLAAEPDADGPPNSRGPAPTP